MSNKPNPRQLLEDLSNELKGSLIEDTFEVHGIQWTMRLLNEDEFTWCFSKTEIDLKNAIAMGISFRLPTLAIGIRAFNGKSVVETFQDDWNELPEDEKEVFLSRPGATPDKIGAEFMLEYLKALPSTFVNELYEKWQELELRRKESQEALKKFSGESGDKDENKS